MAWCLKGTMPSPEPKLPYCQLDTVKFEQNTTVFVHDNTFENVVCKMAAILSQTQGVNTIPTNNYNTAAMICAHIQFVHSLWCKYVRGMIRFMQRHHHRCVNMLAADVLAPIWSQAFDKHQAHLQMSWVHHCINSLRQSDTYMHL